MELLSKDIRYALRSLRSNPGFTLVSILTLALGIGATTAMFSVINGVLLRPLPYADPQRVVMVWEHDTMGEAATDRNPASPANFAEWQKEKAFSSLAANFDWEASVTGAGEPDKVRVGLGTVNLFTTLGAKPYFGSVFSGTDVTAPALQLAMAISAHPRLTQRQPSAPAGGARATTGLRLAVRERGRAQRPAQGMIV